MSPGTWTTLPDEFDTDAWPYEEPDTEPPTDFKIRIDITAGGTTLTVDGHESLLKSLGDLNRVD